MANRHPVPVYMYLVNVGYWDLNFQCGSGFGKTMGMTTVPADAQHWMTTVPADAQNWMTTVSADA